MVRDHLAMIEVTAVQNAPKCLNLTGTLAKVESIPEEAADNGLRTDRIP